MKANKVREIIQLAKKFKEIYDDETNGLISVDTYLSKYNKPTAQVRIDKIAELFGNKATITERNCSEFPYEVAGEIDGVFFFAVCKEEDLKKYFPNNEVEEEEEHDV